MNDTQTYLAEQDSRREALQSLEPLLQFFSFRHLPDGLKLTSAKFCELACDLIDLPRNPERTVALRKLLESKDCAVRAMIAK